MGVHVNYLFPAARSFLGAMWRVDNFKSDGEPKTGNDYVAVRELDENNDGQISSSEKHDEFIYDLRLTNVSDNGVIWVKAHPLTVENSKRDLGVFLTDYADSLAGTGAYYQGTIFSMETVKARQFTTFLTNKATASAPGFTGQLATVEVAEAVRVQMDPAFRSAKVRVFMAKIPYDSPPAPGQGWGGAARPWPTVRCGPDNQVCERRMGLLVIGYVNDAEHFDMHLPEYDGFLSRVSIPALRGQPGAFSPRP
jgi:hypothetical protein